ncbi:unnamed protein product [Linum tenue]|uniref:SAC3/GANP/THP3 conserved domain-containing protein n=1 Tax=Linum tenue TaxID=586396 RepID=A0AAV0KFJ4_9ROSI|nr:unnamed protein product [Linum tenue]
MERNNHRRHQVRPFSSSSTTTSSSSGAGSRGDFGALRESDWRSRRQSTASSKTQKPKPKMEAEGGEKEDGLSEIPAVIGTCPFMCPEGERAQRERLRDLAVFERLHGNPGKTSPSLAVKKFCRTISAKEGQASDIRPLPVLEETLSYLLTLLDSTNNSFEALHDFIFDRTRSIRQDLSMQNIANKKAIYMYEKMVWQVKFHVISHLKLRPHSNKSTTSSIHYLNMEQLTKALTSLYNLYDVNHEDSNSVHENEAEFRSFFVLLHLDSRNQPTGGSLALWFRRLPRSIIQSTEMCFARGVLQSFRLGNYKHFLSTIAAEASYLQYCILEPYVNQVRMFALSCINSVGYKLHPYPLARLSNILIMKESDVELLCNACGLEMCMDEAGNKLLPTKQTSFTTPKDSQCYPVLGLERFEMEY